MVELWYPGATVHPGPANKTWGETDVFGVTCHSSEGNLAGDMAVLRSQVRPRGSWTLYNPRQGPMLQHYPLNAITWHSGSRRSWGTIGVETEGFAGDPLTASQNGNMIEFLGWCKGNFDWDELILDLNIFEHNYWVATACPSNRYLWEVLLPAANAIGGDLMASAEFENLLEQIHNLRTWSMEADRQLMERLSSQDDRIAANNVIEIGLAGRIDEIADRQARTKTTYERLLSINDRVNGLVCTSRAIERTIATHFNTHNTGGSIIEKAGVSILEEVTKLVEKAEESREAILADLDTLRAFIAEGGTTVDAIE